MGRVSPRKSSIDWTRRCSGWRRRPGVSDRERHPFVLRMVGQVGLGFPHGPLVAVENRQRDAQLNAGRGEVVEFIVAADDSLNGDVRDRLARARAGP